MRTGKFFQAPQGSSGLLKTLYYIYYLGLEDISCSLKHLNLPCSPSSSLLTQYHLLITWYCLLL